MLRIEQIDELKGKLNPRAISKRKLYGNSGPELSYVEGWFVIAEANEIFGFDGWSSETVDLLEVMREHGTDHKGNPQWQVAYIAKCKITMGECIREGTGYGSGAMKDLGSAIESATKEAETDARKRALMTFGNKFGLALYDKKQEGVGYDEGQKEDPAFTPRANGGYKDAKGFTAGEMNSAGKKVSLKDIDADLVDATSNFLLDKCYRQWQPVIERWRDSNDTEEQSFYGLAIKSFKDKRAELDAQMIASQEAAS